MLPRERRRSRPASAGAGPSGIRVALRTTATPSTRSSKRCARRASRIGAPTWTVLQVRHTRATDVRAAYGLEGAAASLGNSVEAAQIYAERNRVLASKIALELG